MSVQSETCSHATKSGLTRDWADPALLFAAIVMALMTRGSHLLTDPDTHWHMRVGADIWRTKSLPWIDEYSHTFTGAPWIAKEWLSQVLMYGVHSIAGMTGLVLVSALAIALTFALMFDWLTAHMRAPTALVVTLLAMILLMPHMLARPHIFALVPLLLWTRGIVDALDQNRLPRLWLLGLLMVWANLHGSFTIAYPIVGILALEAVFAAPAEKRIATTLRWAAFGLAAVGAGCVTPYGYHALLITFTLAGGEALPFITEWEPISWNATGVLAMISVLLAIAALAEGGLRNVMRFALVALLTVMMVRHVRFLDVFALVIPLVVAAPLVRRYPRLAPELADPASNWPLRARAGFATATVASVVLMVCAHPKQDPLVTPQAALDAARAAHVSGPVYNSYNYGGFLISQGVPTFIDGRTDQLFLGGFISQLAYAMKEESHTAFIDFVDRHGATWAIVPTGGKEAAHFEATPAWPRLFSDDVASVFVRR